MKPKLLKIAGLNSFHEEQEVDFSKLTEKGLFGIFGPTGSGKSTILDAITMALYDHIPRNTKEYINTDCEGLYVSYEFEISGATGSKSYRIERSKKRNKNGGVNTDFARLCLLDQNGKEEKVLDKVLEIDEEIKNIIGLNHHDFTRSVVLPQGKFSDFLKLTGSDRNKMLERILSLEKYGRKLYDRIKNTRDLNSTDIKVLEERLSGYGGVSDEALKELKKGLEESIREKKILEEKNRELQEKYERLSKVWSLQEELKAFTEEGKRLELQREDIEEKRRSFTLGMKANSLKPYVDSLDETLKSIEDNKKSLKEISGKIENLKGDILKTEESYNLIDKRRNKEIPILIERETKIKGAIDLLSQVEELIKEEKALEKKINDLDNKIKSKNKELETVNIKKADYSKKLDESMSEIKALKITPEYREKINKAWELQKSYDELYKKENEDKDRLKILEENISKKTKELNGLNEELEENNKALQNEQEGLSLLNKDKPKSKENIMHQSYELEKSKERLERAIEENNKLKNIKKELEEIRSKTEEKNQALKSSREKLEEAKKNLEEINKEIIRLEEIHRASIISSGLEKGSPCPVCGSREHPSPTRKIDYTIVEEKKKTEKKLKQSVENRESRIKEIELDIKLLIKEEEKAGEEIHLYLTRLKGIDIKELEKSNKLMEKEILINNEALNKWEKDYEAGEEKIEKTKEKINSLSSRIAVHRESISKDTERKNEIIDVLTTIEGNIKEVLEELQGHKRELRIENIEKEILNIKKNDKRLEKLEKDNDTLREELKELEDKREKVNSELREETIEKSRATEQYNERHRSIEEKKKQINDIVGEENPHRALNDTIEKRNHIIKREEELKKQLEEEKDKLNSLQEIKSGKMNTIDTLEKSLVKIQEDLTKAMEENEFEAVEDVRKNILPKEELQDLKKHIEAYDKEAQRLANNIERVNKELKGDKIEEKQWLELKEEREHTIDKYNNILEVLGQEKEKIKEMEKKLKESNKLREELKVLEYKADMLKDMFSLVSGNRFVEFVAISHLKYIAKEASKRLMDITNNRYSLELDNSGNFIICDNYNGGVRRDCNTLSGGETFVTSLSLALSLSTQIQLKGKTAFEFFFLDEGFGTLDSHLLDTVMSSLERLHEERLSVGIISHVEELKNRIPVKLVVTPSEAGLHGTKVRLENS